MFTSHISHGKITHLIRYVYAVNSNFTRIVMVKVKRSHNWTSKGNPFFASHLACSLSTEVIFVTYLEKNYSSSRILNKNTNSLNKFSTSAATIHELLTVACLSVKVPSWNHCSTIASHLRQKAFSWCF